VVAVWTMIAGFGLRSVCIGLPDGFKKFGNERDLCFALDGAKRKIHIDFVRMGDGVEMQMPLSAVHST